MKIHKVELLIIELHDEYGIDEVLETIKNSTDALVHVVSKEVKNDKKEWDDNHPCNYGAKKAKNYYEKII